MPRDEEFRAKEKKFHKMTRDGLVERGAASGEETRISGREQDFDLRQARDSPDSLEDLSAKARHTRQQRPKDGDAARRETAAACRFDSFQNRKSVWVVAWER